MRFAKPVIAESLIAFFIPEMPVNHLPNAIGALYCYELLNAYQPTEQFGKRIYIIRPNNSVRTFFLPRVRKQQKAKEKG